MKKTKAFLIGLSGAFIGVLAVIVFLFLWQYPLLFSFGLERAAWEEMRVLAFSALVGVVVGYAASFVPKQKPLRTLGAVIVLALAFGVMWLVPLLLPMGSESRLCWEEMRVVAVGALVGVLIGYVLGRCVRRRKK